MNLMAPNTRATVVNALADRDKDLKKEEWARLLESVCFMAREEYRKGDPAIDLWEVPQREGSRWLLEPFVEDYSVTVLFANGGSGKSIFALAIAASVDSGKSIVGNLQGGCRPVLYLDWEADRFTHRERLDAIYRGAKLDRAAWPFLYKRMHGSLQEAAGNIRRMITENSIGFVIVDSMGMARCAEAKDTGPTIELFQAARSFDLPVLIVDHISKEAIKSGNADSPFGNIYTHNEARNTWLLEKVQDEGERESYLVLTHKKCNNGPLQKRRAFKLIFDSDTDERLQCVTFEEVDMKKTRRLADKLSVKDRILADLNASTEGNNSVKAIAESIGVSEAQVQSRMSQLKNEGKVLWISKGRYGRVSSRDG
jgi:RecA-family ATPase